jgi:hypothetical protein
MGRDRGTEVPLARNLEVAGGGLVVFLFGACLDCSCGGRRADANAITNAGITAITNTITNTITNAGITASAPVGRG